MCRKNKSHLLCAVGLVVRAIRAQACREASRTVKTDPRGAPGLRLATIHRDLLMQCLECNAGVSFGARNYLDPLC